MSVLSLDVGWSGDAARLSLRGELDSAGREHVEDALRRLEAQVPPLLVLDLRELTFVDSVGLEVALEADRRARGEGRGFAISLGPGAVSRAFRYAGLEGRFDEVGPDQQLHHGRRPSRLPLLDQRPTDRSARDRSAPPRST